MWLSLSVVAGFILGFTLSNLSLLRWPDNSGKSETKGEQKSFVDQLTLLSAGLEEMRWLLKNKTTDTSQLKLLLHKSESRLKQLDQSAKNLDHILGEKRSG